MKRKLLTISGRNRVFIRHTVCVIRYSFGKLQLKLHYLLLRTIRISFFVSIRQLISLWHHHFPNHGCHSCNRKYLMHTGLCKQETQRLWASPILRLPTKIKGIWRFISPNNQTMHILRVHGFMILTCVSAPTADAHNCISCHVFYLQPHVASYFTVCLGKFKFISFLNQMKDEIYWIVLKV